MRVLTSCRSGLEFCLHFFIEMTQRTGKVVIGDGFDKTLKLHFFQTGGHMGCLYESKAEDDNPDRDAGGDTFTFGMN